MKHELKSKLHFSCVNYSHSTMVMDCRKQKSILFSKGLNDCVYEILDCCLIYFPLMDFMIEAFEHRDEVDPLESTTESDLTKQRQRIKMRGNG